MQETRNNYFESKGRSQIIYENIKNIIKEVKNEEIYISSIASLTICWSYNHYFDFTKACKVPSPIFTSHLNFL